MGNRIMKIAKHGVSQEDWTYSIYSRDATGNVIAVYERKWTSTTSLTSPNADLTIQIPTHPGLGTGLIAIKVNGIYLTNGPVLTKTTSELTAIELANAVNSYVTEQFDFTAEVDGDLVFLFTEKEYTEPLHFEVLNAEPSLIDGDYFDFLDVTVRGFKPYNGTFTQVPLIETMTLQELHLYGSSRLGIKTPFLPIDKKQTKAVYASNYGNSLYLSYLDSRIIPLNNSADGPFFEHNKGLKQYELSNHLGNVLVVFDDKKIVFEGLSGAIGYYKPALLSIHDFYPGGMPLHLRTMNVDGYRYGHNTQESDAEITGNWGSHYTAEFWMYDARLQRRWETDPVVYPDISPYATFANNPIYFNDISGLSAKGSGKGESSDLNLTCGTCPKASDNKAGTEHYDEVTGFLWEVAENDNGTHYWLKTLYTIPEVTVTPDGGGASDDVANQKVTFGQYMFHRQKNNIATKTWIYENAPLGYQKYVFNQDIRDARAPIGAVGIYILTIITPIPGDELMVGGLMWSLRATGGGRVVAPYVFSAMLRYNVATTTPAVTVAAFRMGVEKVLTIGYETKVTKVYRAVDEIELGLVGGSGQFSLGQINMKYFAKSLNDAHWYGRNLYPNGYTILEGTINARYLPGKYWYPHIDIGAYAFPQNTLPLIRNIQPVISP